MTRPSFDELGMATARLWATRSPDEKHRVGACILDERHRVIGVGYNGPATGEDNTRESLEQGWSGFIHGEENALLAANWNGVRHTMYVTHSPCAMCARKIRNTGRVYAVTYGVLYAEPEREARGLKSGIEILRAGGIIVRQASEGLK